MCGITGFISDRPAESAEEMLAHVRRMADTLHHRGPDDTGTWVDAECRVALGHKRLSILDLSPAGHQPMVSACGRYTIVYNGEVYNHAEMHRDLSARGYTFRGHSDTEILLAAIAAWGVEETARRSVGMFAYAVFDRTQRQLTLVRDRLGIKPLYFGWAGPHFVFGSELKSLRAHPRFPAVIDRQGLAQLLEHNYIPVPQTIYQNVWKLKPGTLLTVRLPNGGGPAIADRPRAFWDLHEVAERGASRPFRGSEVEAIEQLERLLREAVAIRMVADVPLGAFLSGGVDSSMVVALMQAQSTIPIRTFTIGFREAAHNEAEYARAVARHLGTQHTEQTVTHDDALQVIPQLPAMYDEPFADSSQIPTYLVSRLARRDVTVSLSGDGGDELFCGYDRYHITHRLWRRIRAVPGPLRSLAATVCQGTGRLGGAAVWAYRAQLLADLLRCAGRQDCYVWLHKLWRRPGELVVGLAEARNGADAPFYVPAGSTFYEEMMRCDALTYLSEDILAKVDRASMAVSLEARVPIIDHRVVEFAWSLPDHWKVREGKTKWLLRQVLYRYVPPTLIERPKSGFSIPIGDWLRGPLLDWADDLLEETRMRGEGYLRPEPIQQRWRQHRTGIRDWSANLWSILMFQAWLRAGATAQIAVG